LKTSHHYLKISTSEAPKFYDITAHIESIISKANFESGIVVVFSKHTTAGILIQEHEPLLLEDLTNLLQDISPKDKEYNHNNFAIRTVHMHEDECPNGHSHCQHILIGTSETIPVIDNSLSLGKWQRIFLVELDEEFPSEREIIVQLIGT
tara:strand:+ start:22662 stop:23111 length:450 start_codon:yes stop_codon:yes gene_type:complete